ncbi:MAG: response regulator [Proteobacteria bacterium]|nr:response regulator [Pseudomonadota bacterium]MBU1390029.1 response regulator [Pseudomonadota bacterium]MBU1545020.1 response regulator [Pseudomonadota bacterium]MBU2430331.1 response regulator [Pseudomonadota bacterium]MBU2480376.1 response regulator [Pseudomonadota bacterium]
MPEKIKVMMVDDEARFRETTATLLRKKGFETTIAGSGEEAVNIIKTSPQDVVVLDVKMGGMDGHVALEKIKKLSPQTQVIMLTGHGSPGSADNSRKLEAFDYLIKPCDIDILALKINEAYAVQKTGAARTEKKVKDIMTEIENYSTITVNNTIREAVIKLMSSLTELVSSNMIREAGHRSLIVFDEQHNFVGILRIKDLIKGASFHLSTSESSKTDSIKFSHVFTSGWDGLFTIQMKALADKKIGELTLEAPPMIDGNANLMEVANLLFKTKRTRLIVTSGKKVIGILREQDLFFEIVNIITR